MRPASAWMRWCSAPAAPTRCTGAPSGCRWGMPCWCRMRGRQAWPSDLELLRDNGFRLLAMTPDPLRATLADAMAAVADEQGGDSGRRRGAGPDRTGDAGQRPAGAHPDVAGHRLAQRRHRRRRWRSTNGLGCAHVTDDSTPWAMGLTVAAFVAAVIAAPSWCSASASAGASCCWRSGSTWSQSAGLHRRSGNGASAWYGGGLCRAGVGVAGAWLALLAIVLGR